MNTLKIASRPKVRKFVPSPEQAVAMESVRRSSEWFHALPVTELAKYAGQNVAVLECRVVAATPTLAELITKIEGCDRSRLYIVPQRRSRIRFRPA